MRVKSQYLNRDEFELILKSEKDKKFRLAFLLGGEAGLRISEIIGYKGRFRRINKKTGVISEGDVVIPALTKEMVNDRMLRIISGKGNKDRVAPRPKRMNEESLKLLPLTINRRTLQYRITRLGKKILNKHITFHTLRHFFITECSNKGIPLHHIQAFAGHSRLDTTGRYAHSNPQIALKQYEELF